MKVKNERQISLEVNEEALYSLIAHEIAKKYPGTIYGRDEANTGQR